MRKRKRRKLWKKSKRNESWKRLPQKAREDSKRLACAGKRELKRGEAERITTQRMATTWRMAAKAPSSAEKAFPRRKRSRRRKRRKKKQRSQRRMVLRHPPRLRAARVRIRIRALPRIPTTTSIPKPPRRKNRKRKKRRPS